MSLGMNDTALLMQMRADLATVNSNLARALDRLDALIDGVDDLVGMVYVALCLGLEQQGFVERYSELKDTVGRHDRKP